MPKKILLVEDEALIAMSTARRIQKHGYEAVTAYKGEKAVEVLEADPEISLVLMDIDLGKGIDGTKAAQRILEKRETPIVFHTSHSEKEYVEKVKKITSYGYVLKNSGEFVLIESINMAYELFEAHSGLKRENERRRQSEKELEAIHSHTPVLTLLIDAEFNVRKANTSTSALSGSSMEDLAGLRTGRALRCIHHLDDPRGCGYGPQCRTCMIRRTVLDTFTHRRGYKKVEADFEHLNDSGSETINFLLSTSYVAFEEQPLAIVSLEDVSEQKHVENKLKESEENLRITLDSIGDAVIATNNRGNIIRMNPVAARLCGWKTEEALGEKLEKVFHIVNAYTRTRVDNPVDKVMQTGEIVGLANHTVLIAKDGREYQIADSAAPIRDDHGNISGVVLVFRDVTHEYEQEQRLHESEKKYRELVETSPIDITDVGRSNEDKDLLLRELNHRVKNNLLMVSSLISLKESEIQIDLSDIRHQVDAIRLVHEKLLNTKDVSRIEIKSYIQDLLNTVFSSFTEQDVRIESKIDGASMQTKTAIPLGLIVNEIATNAIKHGFSDPREARFTLTLTEDGKDKSYILTISNTGKPFPEEISLENPTTLGLQLITTLVNQMDGTIGLQKRPFPVYTIRFPID